jgi:HTH-type transcriptional regulator, sugar sensing transcriptional regulator
MELLSKLQQIGLTPREAEVYMALLQKKDFTAPELTKITTITRTKIYEILQNLVRKGVCNESYRDGLKVYKGIKPQVALQNIIMNYENEMEQKKNTAVEVMKEVATILEKELAAIHKNNQDNKGPMDYIEVLTDIGQIRERWLTIRKNTKYELLVFTKPPYTAALEEIVEAEAKIIKSNIIEKSIYEYNNINSEEEIKNLITSLEAYQIKDEQARIMKELPMKLAISDETITMLALTDRISMEPSITSMIIDHPTFAKAQKKVFESYWKEAMTIEEFKIKLNKQQ